MLSFPFRSAWSRGWLTLIASLGLLAPARAVDPLPSHLRSAPEHVQRAYIESEARRSRAEQLQVGRQRYENRVEQKQATLAFVESVAAANREQLQMEQGRPGTSEDDVLGPISHTTFWPWLLGLTLVGGGAWILKRKLTLAQSAPDAQRARL